MSFGAGFLAGAIGCQNGASSDVDAGPEASTPRARVDLVDAEEWQLVEEADDPFEDRPDGFRCLEASYRAQDLGGERVFDVETDTCEYITVTQPSLADVLAGDFLKARVFHFDLRAPSPAEAHVAIGIGSDVPVDVRVPIPSEGALIGPVWQAPRDIAAGTPVYFHLHNHGTNSWAMVELSSGPERPPGSDETDASAEQ